MINIFRRFPSRQGHKYVEHLTVTERNINLLPVCQGVNIQTWSWWSMSIVSKRAFFLKSSLAAVTMETVNASLSLSEEKRPDQLQLHRHRKTVRALYSPISFPQMFSLDFTLISGLDLSSLLICTHIFYR